MSGSTAFDYSPSGVMENMQAVERVQILRRVRTGKTTMNEPIFEWRRVARIPATIMPVSGLLRMTEPGMAALTTHTFYTRYREDPKDGGYIVRAKDIVVDSDGTTYSVETIGDEASANSLLTGTLRQGVLEDLQNLDDQG